jgi:hypothetical protein
MSISTTKIFCLFGTLSFQVSGIGRDNIMQSVTALKNPFKIETNLIEKLQYPYVIVISQDFAIGWQRNITWKNKIIVYDIVNITSMYTTTRNPRYGESWR